MNFIEFTKAFGNSSVIDIRNVITYFDGLDRRRLYEWQEKGYIKRIANNFYVFAEKPIEERDLKTIACRIYQPSYVSLESALAFYHFIPEAVFQAICITTRRNKIIKTSIGEFAYRSIKPVLFFGYQSIESGNKHFFIADPEKALLDMLYFLPNADEKGVLEGMRFNAEEILQKVDMETINDYLRLFCSPKLDKAVKRLMEIIHAEF